MTTASEHISVLDPIGALFRLGADIETLPIDRRGRVDPQVLKEALLEPTTLVCLMAANNQATT